MAEKIFMRVNEVAEELKAAGCITIAGRIDRKFFYEKFYGTRDMKKEETNGGI